MKPEDLKLCIEALKALQSEMYQKMDASVAERLDGIILQLEGCLSAGGNVVEVPTGTRHETLVVLSEVIRFATNLCEIIRLWSDMM
jgi:hypothetical protein